MADTRCFLISGRKRMNLKMVCAVSREIVSLGQLIRFDPAKQHTLAMI